MPSPSLLRASALSFQASPFSKTLTFPSQPSPLLFSSSTWKKAMSDDWTPDGRPGRSGSPHGRGGSDSSGNSSVYGEKYYSKSSNFSPRMRQTSSEMNGSNNLRGLESDLEVSSGKFSMYREDKTSRSSVNDRMNRTPQPRSPRLRQTSPEMMASSNNVSGPESKLEACTFDICRTRSGSSFQLNKSLFEINREKRRELELSKHVSQSSKSLLEVNQEKRRELELSKHVLQAKYLRSGMFLLKNYIGHSDQVKIIQKCRELGIGKGGFYRPGYTDGSKLQLQMMCLGKNWDPESHLYEDRRRIDDTEPPIFPEEFRQLVVGAIHAVHDYLQQKNRGIDVEDELPSMDPDICIVNFYSNNGKLGLHQDKDESKKSIYGGVPIVSFSLGDSAEFLFGETRDEDIAEKLVLESGDVLIFGGKSRLLFHGVSAIIPKTAPKSLIDETNLKPGRLNLTFRQRV